MSDHYILVGHDVVPASLMEWAQWLDGDIERRRVASDHVNGKWISTVFLGLNHRFASDEDGPPLVFETMVFNDGEWDELWMERCSTWDEAVAMHAKGCDAARTGDFDASGNN